VTHEVQPAEPDAMKSVLKMPVVLVSLAIFATGGYAEWGDVSMTFVYDGVPPEPKPFIGGRPGGPVLDETWVVDKKGGVKNVVVRLLPEKDVVLPIHPDFDKAKGTTASIDIVNSYFEPRICIKYTNQNLQVNNMDPLGHNVKANVFNNKSFNILIPANKGVILDTEQDELNKHETAPMHLVDSIYPEMQGYLLIHSHPYAAVSDKSGRLKLKNVPVGEWTFVMWHEAVGNIREGKLDGTATKWPKGRIKLKVEPKLISVGTVAFKERGGQ
jgi:hypothetical protein